MAGKSVAFVSSARGSATFPHFHEIHRPYYRWHTGLQDKRIDRPQITDNRPEVTAERGDTRPSVADPWKAIHRLAWKTGLAI